MSDEALTLHFQSRGEPDKRNREVSFPHGKGLLLLPWRKYVVDRLFLRSPIEGFELGTIDLSKLRVK